MKRPLAPSDGSTRRTVKGSRVGSETSTARKGSSTASPGEHLEWEAVQFVTQLRMRLRTTGSVGSITTKRPRKWSLSGLSVGKLAMTYTSNFYGFGRKVRCRY